MFRIALGLLILTSVSLSAGCGTSGDAADAQIADVRPTVTFSVEGMACEESCAKKVHELLAGQPGVQEANVDFEAKSATCVVDKDKFDPAGAIAELADQDFVAEMKN